VRLVGVGEFADLQVDDDQAAQPAVEQQQVHPVPLAADADALLAGDEGEARPQFQQELLQVTDQGLFQVSLAVLVLEVEELEQVGVADGLLDGDGVLGPGLLPPAEHGFLVAGQGRALVELRADLPVELAHGPGPADGLVLVEPAGEVVLDCHQADVVGPGQREGVQQRGGGVERKLGGPKGL
jgi:hypothetical protein